MDKFFEVISSLIPLIIFIFIITKIKKTIKKGAGQNKKFGPLNIIELINKATKVATENSVKGKSSSRSQPLTGEQGQSETPSHHVMMKEPIVNKEPPEDLDLVIKSDWRAKIFIFIIIVTVIFLALKYINLENILQFFE